MTSRHVQPGKVLDYVNATGSAIASGAPLVVGALVGVALGAIAIGATGSVQICSVFKFPKAAGAIAQGAKVYLKADGTFTTTASGNTLAGNAAADAADAAPEVNVLLNGVPG